MKVHRLKSDQNCVKHTHSRVWHTASLHSFSLTTFLIYFWWRWNQINCQHPVGGVWQCEVRNLETATAQGQTSVCGSGGKWQPELQQGRERKAEKRLGGNTTDALIGVSQMSSLRGQITWAWRWLCGNSCAAIQPWRDHRCHTGEKEGERHQDRGVADKNANVGFSYWKVEWRQPVCVV